MNYIVDTQQEVMTKDLPVSTTFSLTIFFGAALCGVYFFDLFKRIKQTESDVKELNDKYSEIQQREEFQDDTIQEHEQRIREKKDFDEFEEIEDHKYQAWNGSYKGNDFSMTIRIWREKCSTVKKNQEWVHWDGERDSSCIVRDFYLGNSNPEFSWIFHHLPDSNDMQAEMRDTLINGWDSVLKIRIDLKAPSKSEILNFLLESSFQGNETTNKVLKKCIDDNLLIWSRILIDEPN